MENFSRFLAEGFIFILEWRKYFIWRRPGSVFPPSRLSSAGMLSPSEQTAQGTEGWTTRFQRGKKSKSESLETGQNFLTTRTPFHRWNISLKLHFFRPRQHPRMIKNVKLATTLSLCSPNRFSLGFKLHFELNSDLGCVRKSTFHVGIWASQFWEIIITNKINSLNVYVV